MKICLIITYLLNLFDLFITTYWINKFGIEIEANPIGRWLYKNRLMAPVKIIVIGILLIILHKAILTKNNGLESSFQWWDAVSWIILIVYGLLALYHIIIYFYLT